MNKKSNSGTLENVAFQMKQGKLDRFGTGSKLITQNGVNKAIMLYVIEELEPLSIVDRCSFIELIKIGLPSHIKIMNRQALTSNLETTYNRMKENLIAHLAKIDFVTTTADLWSKSKRSFLGMTVHWINPESLERESAVIACKRIEGNHTYDVLAKEMNDIHQEYHIHNKITFTVTDNASNFVKSFKIFAKEDEKINNDDETFHSLMDVLSSSRFEHCNDSDFENIENDITLITLPQHMRCACHTLNLIAVHDTEEAMNDSVYKKIYRSTFAKCSKLWSKQNQSTQIADYIHKVIGVYLVTPVITRWNSIFDALKQLQCIIKEKGVNELYQCMDFCNLPRFTDNEVKFINEYIQVMTPLAVSLDILQGEQGMYIGYLLPVLTSLLNRLTNLEEIQLQYCLPLVYVIKNGVRTRFKQQLNRKEFLIASCLHPRFKLNWLNEQCDEQKEKKDVCKKYLIDLLEPLLNQQNRSIQDQPLTSKRMKYDYDNFFQYSKHNEEKNIAEEKITHYLHSDDTDVSMLNEHLLLKKLFVRYNTSLPSSASVERLFNIGGLVLSNLRHRLTDEHFEQQLLLKKNSRFREINP